MGNCRCSGSFRWGGQLFLSIPHKNLINDSFCDWRALLLQIPQIPPSERTYYFLFERFSWIQSITLLGSTSPGSIVEVSFTERPVMDLAVPLHLYIKHHSYQVFSISIIFRIYVVFHKPSNFVQSQKWKYFTQKSRIETHDLGRQSMVSLIIYFWVCWILKFSFLMRPNPLHILQTSLSPWLLSKYPFPEQMGQNIIRYLSGVKLTATSVCLPLMQYLGSLRLSTTISSVCQEQDISTLAWHVVENICRSKKYLVKCNKMQ
jgi:hypothetical protein